MSGWVKIRPGADVLPAPDHHVLDTAGDVEVAVGVHDGQIPGVHPAGRVDRFGGLVRFVPVAEHYRVAPGAQLAGLTPRDGQPGLGVRDLDLEVRVHQADGGYPPVQRVVR